jgi:squalene-hopene/tetraprenyl-beta-curcumene cyclase
MFPGGWNFSCQSTWYPDVDDTAVVVIALLKQDPESVTSTCVMKATNVRETGSLLQRASKQL